MSKYAPIIAAVFATIFAPLPALAQGHGLTPNRGTEGLDPVVIDVENTGELTLSCAVSLAHWYSFELGSLAHSVSLKAVLWSDRKTGEVFLLNPIGDQMPVERIWCGVAGRSWDTRFEAPLKRRANAIEEDFIVSCESSPSGAAVGDAAEIVCAPR